MKNNSLLVLRRRMGNPLVGRKNDRENPAAERADFGAAQKPETRVGASENWMRDLHQ
jgi:hypothetical protein